MMMNSGRNWLTIKQAADYLQLHPNSVRRYVKNRILVAKQIVPNGKILISEESIEKMMNSPINNCDIP